MTEKDYSVQVVTKAGWPYEYQKIETFNNKMEVIKILISFNTVKR